MARRIEMSSIAVPLRGRREKRCVPYHPIVEDFPVVPALDPPWLIIFVIIFAGCALLTLRRPGFGAAALVAIAPFAGAHTIWGTTITGPKIALLGVIVGLTGTAAVWKPLARKPLAIVVAAFAAVVVANLLTLPVAAHRAEVVRETLKWLEYLAFFCTVVIAYAADPAERSVRLALFSSILVACTTALAEIFTGAHSGIWIGNAAVPRLAGVLEGPNQLGGYLEAAIAAVGAWQMRRPGWFGLLLLLLCGATLALTFSRAAALCVVLIVVLYAAIERRAALRLWPLACGLAAGYACALAWAAYARAAPAGMFERESDVNAAISGGLGDRTELWRAARFFFIHHPLLGIGAGNYQFELAEAGLPGVRTQANSWYLQAAAEGGVVLLAATVGWIATIVRALYRSVRTSPWALAGLAATCAFVVHGFVDDLVFYPKVAEAWIALVALGVADPLARRAIIDGP
jgi:O-antigen ligase